LGTSPVRRCLVHAAGCQRGTGRVESERGQRQHGRGLARQRAGHHQSARPGDHAPQSGHPAHADRAAGLSDGRDGEPGPGTAAVPAVVLPAGGAAMSVSTRKLRLGPLPKTESVKLTFTCTVVLKEELDRYASMHAQVYGRRVDAAALIPHMLEAFM